MGAYFLKNLQKILLQVHYKVSHYMKKIKKSEAILILLDIRSAYNVGAIFRTADGAGEKFQIIAREQDEGSIDYKKIKIRKKAALILGSETEGIPEKILKRCDSIAEIPMRGQKESLNVSVAAGIALYQMI